MKNGIEKRIIIIDPKIINLITTAETERCLPIIENRNSASKIAMIKHTNNTKFSGTLSSHNSL